MRGKMRRAFRDQGNNARLTSVAVVMMLCCSTRIIDEEDRQKGCMPENH